MLREQSGIHSIKVALLAERGVIEYDPNVWDTDKLIEVGFSPW
jgi:Cu+-exporting ATPase